MADYLNRTTNDHRLDQRNDSEQLIEREAHRGRLGWPIFVAIAVALLLALFAWVPADWSGSGQSPNAPIEQTMPSDTGTPAEPATTPVQPATPAQQ